MASFAMARAAPPDRLSTVSDRLFAALMWCEADPSPLRHQCRVLFEVHSSILNGGFEGLLDNPTGELVPEAATAAATIGANRCSEILAQVVRLLGGRYPVDLAAREELVDSLNDVTWESVEALGDQWPDSEAPDAISAMIDSNPAAFWSHPATPDEEALLLLEYLPKIVGEALFHPNQAAARALDDLTAWVARHGTDEQRTRVGSERRRLDALRR